MSEIWISLLIQGTWKGVQLLMLFVICERRRLDKCKAKEQEICFPEAWSPSQRLSNFTLLPPGERVRNYGDLTAGVAVMRNHKKHSDFLPTDANQYLRGACFLLVGFSQ